MTITQETQISHALTDADDRRHRLDHDAMARESLIFLLFLPDDDLGCIAYTWVDGEGKAGSLILVFASDNRLLFRSYTEGVVVPADADFDDWKVGELHVQHGAPHQQARVTFGGTDDAGRRFALDYDFTAMTPAFTYHDNQDGCPRVLADNRLEQSGWVKGTIVAGDEPIAFDTTGHRDHSWGKRDWTAFHQYMWINVQTPSGTCVNLMHGFIIDRLYQLGYVQRDGIQSPIVSIDVVLDRDIEHLTYERAQLTLVDELGRATHIAATERTALAVWPAGGLESHDAAGWCDVDGERGLLHIEEGWNPDFVKRRQAAMRIEQEGVDSAESKRWLSVNRGVGAADA